MRKGTLVRSASVLALGLLSGMTMAATTLTVDIEGPGGGTLMATTVMLMLFMQLLELQ